MGFRKENRDEAFKRQISALRQQMDADPAEDEVEDDAVPMNSTTAYDRPTYLRPEPVRSFSEASESRSSTNIATASTSGVLAAGSTWSGTLTSDGSLRILGRVEGKLSATDEVFVAEGAVVEADTEADSIVVAGTVDGTITCRTRLEVLPTGTVTGDVNTPSLIVHEGAVISGDLHMGENESDSE